MGFFIILEVVIINIVLFVFEFLGNYFVVFGLFGGIWEDMKIWVVKVKIFFYLDGDFMEVDLFVMLLIFVISFN